MTIINSKFAPEPIGPYSQAVRVGDTLYCSGQIALSPETGEFEGGDIVSQTERICANIEAVLKEAGLAFSDVVKTTCYLADMADFPAFNEVYGKYFAHKPARSCIAAKALPKNALAEIEVLAGRTRFSRSAMLD